MAFLPIHKPLLQRLGALAVTGWLAWAAGAEIYRAVNRQVLDPPQRQPAIAWRWGSPPVARLERFLGRAAPHLAPEAKVTFVSPGEGNAVGAAEFFRFLWASYFLGDRTVIPSFDAAASQSPYWVAFAHRLDRPELELVYEDPAGAVYRLRPAGSPP